VAGAGYTFLAKLLHWLTALLVIGLLCLGLWMVGLPNGGLKSGSIAWHKGIGVTVLALTVLRLLWLWRAKAPALPASVGPWERRLAPWSHTMLLVLLLVMPISGWLMSSAGGNSVVWFGVLPLPDLVDRDPLLAKMLRTLHHWSAYALIAVIVLHVGAVIRHDMLRRDGIFRRMWF